MDPKGSASQYKSVTDRTPRLPLHATRGKERLEVNITGPRGRSFPWFNLGKREKAIWKVKEKNKDKIHKENIPRTKAKQNILAEPTGKTRCRSQTSAPHSGRPVNPIDAYRRRNSYARVSAIQCGSALQNLLFRTRVYWVPSRRVSWLF